VPMLFIMSTTFTAAATMVSGRFWPDMLNGFKTGNLQQKLQGGLCSFAIVFLVGSFVVILGTAIAKISTKIKVSK
jgi:hypothetical protein